MEEPRIVRHFKNLNRFIGDVVKQIDIAEQRLQLENRLPQVRRNLGLRLGLLLMFSNDLLHLLERFLSLGRSLLRSRSRPNRSITHL